MIYEIVSPTKYDPNRVYLKPLYCIDAWEAYNMLDQAFPYNHDTYMGNSWEFRICCFNGYENCLQFKKGD